MFFLAIILKYVFSVRLGWLPSIGRQDVLIDAEHPTKFYVLDGIIARNWTAAWDAIKHLILPAIALGSIPLAIIARSPARRCSTCRARTTCAPRAPRVCRHASSTAVTCCETRSCR